MALTNIINLLFLVLLTAFATMVTSEVYSDDLDLEQFSELFSKRDAVEGECKQQRFWATDVKRKWTFCIIGERFGWNSRVNRL